MTRVPKSLAPQTASCHQPAEERPHTQFMVVYSESGSQGLSPGMRPLGEFEVLLFFPCTQAKDKFLSQGDIPKVL